MCVQGLDKILVDRPCWREAWAQQALCYFVSNQPSLCIRAVDQVIQFSDAAATASFGAAVEDWAASDVAVVLDAVILTVAARVSLLKLSDVRPTKLPLRCARC